MPRSLGLVGRDGKARWARDENINDGWVFHDGFSEALTRAPAPGADVTLPHNAVDLPLSYFDEKSYQRAFCYQKTLAWRPEFEGKEISLAI